MLEQSTWYVQVKKTWRLACMVNFTYIYIYMYRSPFCDVCVHVKQRLWHLNIVALYGTLVTMLLMKLDLSKNGNTLYSSSQLLLLQCVCALDREESLAALNAGIGFLILSLLNLSLKYSIPGFKQSITVLLWYGANC